MHPLGLDATMKSSFNMLASKTDRSKMSVTDTDLTQSLNLLTLKIGYKEKERARVVRVPGTVCHS